MNQIRVKPVISDMIILWGDDENQKHVLIKAQDCESSLVSFDKRQIWKVRPYKTSIGNTDEYYGACEYKNLYIRLCPNDFKRIFGDDIVERCERGESL